jgi:hypothetical protein
MRMVGTHARDTTGLSFCSYQSEVGTNRSSHDRDPLGAVLLCGAMLATRFVHAFLARFPVLGGAENTACDRRAVRNLADARSSASLNEGVCEFRAFLSSPSQGAAVAPGRSTAFQRETNLDNLVRCQGSGVHGPDCGRNQASSCCSECPTFRLAPYALPIPLTLPE